MPPFRLARGSRFHLPRRRAPPHQGAPQQNGRITLKRVKAEQQREAGDRVCCDNRQTFSEHVEPSAVTSRDPNPDHRFKVVSVLFALGH